MADYLLSRRAERDLRNIFDYTDKTFGRNQAETYLFGLKRVFGLLADFPDMGRPADEIGPGLRRFRF